MVLHAVWQLPNTPLTLYAAPPGVDLHEFAQANLPSSCVFIDDSELPQQDFDYYNAWCIVDGAVQVDLNKARQITKDRLREERKPLLLQLDVDFMKALEAGVSTAAIVAEKQRLRDITLAADACASIADLRALTCTQQQ
jgi:hypothetical protein